MKANKRNGLPSAGPEGFEAYYASLWAERWPALRAALTTEALPLPWSAGLARPYALDPASVLAALALGRPVDDACLDLCAAPGGKSLVIAGRMTASTLVCNELSVDRSFRLRRVLEEHLSREAFPSVSFLRADGAALCRKRPASFDRILVDAPCSSERHVLASPLHLGQWSTARIRALPVRQWALLSSAFLMLRPGGRLVYATCSVNPAENEAVFGRLFSKYGDAARELEPRTVIEGEIRSLEEPWRGMLGKLLDRCETRGRGIALLPDACGFQGAEASAQAGAGPMYIAIAEKESS